jgi:hypothetical protein
MSEFLSKRKTRLREESARRAQWDPIFVELRAERAARLQEASARRAQWTAIFVELRATIAMNARTQSTLEEEAVALEALARRQQQAPAPSQMTRTLLRSSRR